MKIKIAANIDDADREYVEKEIGLFWITRWWNLSESVMEQKKKDFSAMPMLSFFRLTGQSHLGL